MTIRAGFFGKTQHFAVTAVADDFQVHGSQESRHAFLVQSDKTVHLTRVSSSESAAPASVTNGLRIPVNTPVLVNTVSGDTLSWVLGTGETDGNIWFTEVDH
jgi:hypothetical protein